MEIKQDIKSYVGEMGFNAYKASSIIAIAPTEQKSLCLKMIAEDIDQNRQFIKEENEKDVGQAC